MQLPKARADFPGGDTCRAAAPPSGAGVPSAADTPSPEQVRRQLGRILASPDFACGTRVKRFLEYIVDQALTGNARRLKQYTIATEVLGRDATFDPEADPIVRLEAGKLRRALELYYLRAGAADPVVVSVPKGGYVPVFEAVAPPAGSDQSFQSPADAAEPEVAPVRDLDTQRLCVLSFGVPADGGPCEGLALGLVDQLTVELARYRDFAVVPLDGSDATSSSGHQADGLAAASAANARFVLSGSVRRSETHIRVTGRLHDVETGSIIWTESYDVEISLASSLDTLDDLANRMASAVADYFGVISHTLSLQAVYGPPRAWNLQDCVHRHRYLARTLTRGVYRIARKDLEHGAVHAPQHSMVWAALAHTVFYGNVFGFDRDEDWQVFVHRYAHRSLELDHRCAFAHVVLALHQLYHGEFDDVFRTCERIAEHNPHAPSTRLSCGFFRALAGDWEAGRQAIDVAVRTLPHPPAWAYRVTFLDAFRQGDFCQALQAANQYHSPEHFTPSVLRAAALSRLGRTEDAKTAACEVFRTSPNFRDIAPDYLRYLVPVSELRSEFVEALRPSRLLD